MENSYKIIENRHACGVPVFKISIKICGKRGKNEISNKTDHGFFLCGIRHIGGDGNLVFSV